MKKLFLILMSLILVLFSGCTSPVRDDLFNYINVKLPPITHLERSALEEYNQIISDKNFSSEKLLNAFNKSIIPKYSEFVLELKKITLTTDEVEEVHDIYIKGAEKQLEAFMQFKEGIEKTDKEITAKAFLLLQESKDYMDKYQAKIIELAEKQDLKYKLE